MTRTSGWGTAPRQEEMEAGGSMVVDSPISMGSITGRMPIAMTGSSGISTLRTTEVSSHHR